MLTAPAAEETAPRGGAGHTPEVPAARHPHPPHGQSPQAWLQGIRLDTAAELLETTDLGTEAIADSVGLGTATNLRTQFSAVYGVPPSRYRGTFRAAATR